MKCIISNKQLATEPEWGSEIYTSFLDVQEAFLAYILEYYSLNADDDIVIFATSECIELQKHPGRIFSGQVYESDRFGCPHDCGCGVGEFWDQLALEDREYFIYAENIAVRWDDVRRLPWLKYLEIYKLHLQNKNILPKLWASLLGKEL